jgi:hypothetical protein
MQSEEQGACDLSASYRLEGSMSGANEEKYQYFSFVGLRLNYGDRIMITSYQLQLLLLA